MTLGEQLSEDQKLLIRQALGDRWNTTHQAKNLTGDQEERDRLTERLRFIEETVADIEGL